MKFEHKESESIKKSQHTNFVLVSGYEGFCFGIIGVLFLRAVALPILEEKPVRGLFSWVPQFKKYGIILFLQFAKSIQTGIT